MGAFDDTHRWSYFLMSLVFHISSNCSGSLRMMTWFHKCPVMLSTKRFLPSSMSNPHKAGMPKSTTSISIGISLRFSGVDRIRSTMPLDLISVSPNWKSRSDSIMGMGLGPANWAILFSVWLPTQEIGAPVSTQSSMGL